MLSGIAPVLFRQAGGVIDEPFAAADIRRSIHRTSPTDPAEMEREAGSQRKHVVSEAIRFPVAVEVLKGSRAGEFRDGAYPSGDTVLTLHAV